MHAIHREFTKIINGTTQFTIPVFQRDYTWSESNCEQLWKDVLHVARTAGPHAHFLGSFVYAPTGRTAAGFTQYQVIDGQQRLTTWTLMMIALRDHIESSGFKGDDDGPTVKRINAYFLRNEQEEGSRRYKLVLRRHDQETLHGLIDGRDLPTNASAHIADNYEYFRDLLRGADPALVYEGLGRLIVVDVSLDASDNPQLVFESLNSTGVDLSQTDLIRNFLLMGLPESKQDLLYETRWSKIENLFRGFNSTFDAFARDYIALRTKASKQEKSSNVYRSFRDCFESLVIESGGLEPLLDDLLRFARYYAAFSFGQGVSDSVRGPIMRLSRLVDVPAILVMRLFDCRERCKSLSESEFVETLQLLESYVLRRSVCSGQTRGYWQIFADLAYELDPDRPIQSLKGLLAIQHESYAFPSDAEFGRSLAERDLYHMRNCLHILEQLENHGSREPTDTRTLQIEHILPQNERLNAAWREMLGANWREVRQRWLNRLGNLTLTGYNSTYSDRSFADKKSIKGGFSESAVRLNKYVREQAAWTEREMEKRTQQLVSQAQKIWPALEVDANVVRAVEQERLRKRAAKRDVASVVMSDTARALFDALRARIRTFDAEVTEMVEGKSVSYHAPYFFLEVLPRKNRLTLLLPLNYSELQEAPSIAADATAWEFIVHAKHSGGVLLRIKSIEDIEDALPLIRQAHEAVRTEP